MAHLRSIEQQYWNLAQANVHVWASSTAVDRGAEILEREKAKQKAGNGNPADMVEAEQRFEQFQLDLVTRTSGAMTAEMQLRELMGLPRKDDRRIVPATKATEALVDPDWDKSLAVMLEKQPDVVRSRSVREGKRSFHRVRR